MTKKLRFDRPCFDPVSARVGGGALIGNVIDWPIAPGGPPLTLVMSFPCDLLNRYAGFDLPDSRIVSVFSYYSQDEYFLDCITYHGSQEELDWLRKGFTKVVLHEPGSEVFQSVTIPAMKIAVETTDRGTTSFGGSSIGGEPCLLQAEALIVEDQKFALQVYGNDFPRPYQGIFGLSDAVGYVFIDPAPVVANAAEDVGTFFVQVT